MNERKLLSVIVPVYNLEEYIEKTVFNILQSSYPNIEIILINDGSADKTEILCDKLSAKFDNVYVYHKENGGVSSARNLGIEKANGDYIAFVDGDDIIEPDMFENQINNLERYNCDMSVSQLGFKYLNGKTNEFFKEQSGYLDKNFIIENYFFNEFIKNNFWGPVNKIFKKKLIENIEFKNYAVGEDLLFIFETLKNCNKIYYEQKIGYWYIKRINSATTSSFNSKKLDYIKACHDIVDICEKNYPFALENAKLWLFKNILNIIFVIIGNNKENEYRDFIKINYEYLKQNKYLLNKLPQKSKIYYFCIFHIKVIVKCIYKVKYKI